MQKLVDSVEIKATPKKVFQWFMSIDKTYIEWHPDHNSWLWTKGKPFEVGSRAIIKEYIHGKVHSLKSSITGIKNNELIEYDFLFPYSLIVPRGTFTFQKTGSHCVFTATLFFRYGKVFSRIFKKHIEALTIHMKEEGENLKRLLE